MGRPFDRRLLRAREETHENGILAGGRCGAGAGSAGYGWRYHQDRVRQHVQRPDRGDRQRHAQFVRACARPSWPQDGRQAGRGDLRGRHLQTRRRQAEDREADPVRQGRLHRRLYLVERAARLAEADRGFEDDHGRRECRSVAARRRTLLALRVLDLLAERPDAGGDGPLHEPEGREVGIPDRPELCRRQGHAGRRQEHLQGRGQGRGIYGVADPARLFGRTHQGAGLRRRLDLRVLSGRCRRAVSQSVCRRPV